MTMTPTSTTTESNATSGSVEGPTVNIEPNSIDWSNQSSKSAVLSSRGRAREPGRGAEDHSGGDVAVLHALDPDCVHGSRADHPAADKAQERRQRRECRPGSPAVATSVRACPAKDCPRSTVKMPTTPDTTDTSAPSRRAVRTVPFENSPGSRIQRTITRAPPRMVSHQRIAALIATSHDEHATVNAQHVDVMAVERTQHLGLDDFFGRATRHTPIGDVDHPVHDWQQWVHLVRRQENRHVLIRHDRVQELDDLLALPGRGWRVARRGARVQAYSRARGRSTLAAAHTRQRTDTPVREGRCLHRFEHFVDQFVGVARTSRQPVPVPVDPQSDKIAHPYWHVGLEENLLGT